MVHKVMRKGKVAIAYTDKGLVVDPSDLDGIKRVLDTRGVAIVRGVLDAATTGRVHQSLCRSMHHVTHKLETPFEYADKSTWPVIQQLLPRHDSLHQQWGLTHDPCVWKDVRANDTIIGIYAHLYGVPKEELVASMDGINMGPRHKGYKGHYNMHCDQRYALKADACQTVQGWISMFDVPVGAGTLRFFDGGHRFHQEYYETFKEQFDDPANKNFDPKSDWHVIASKNARSPGYDFYCEKGCVDSAVVCQKGDLVLWKSTTPHTGIEAWLDEDLTANDVPIPTDEHGTPCDPFRMVAYVSYMPRRYCSPQSFKKRHNTLIDATSATFGRTHSHYADMRRVFARYPQTYPAPRRSTADQLWKLMTPLPVDPAIFADPAVRKIAGL
jgi:hypothetical protein